MLDHFRAEIEDLDQTLGFGAIHRRLSHDGRRCPHDVMADIVGQPLERETFAPLRFQDHLSTVGSVHRYLLSMRCDVNDYGADCPGGLASRCNGPIENAARFRESLGSAHQWVAGDRAASRAARSRGTSSTARLGC